MPEPNPTKTTISIPTDKTEAKDATAPKTPEETPEEIQREFDAFVTERLTKWDGNYIVENKAKILMTSSPLSEVDYEASRKIDVSSYGAYTMNPETIAMNHKEKEPTVKIVGKELEELNGRLKSQVMARVVEKYGKDYYIPGLEYAKYLLELEKENPGKIFQTIPQTMGRYYLMGSMIRGKDGRMSVF